MAYLQFARYLLVGVAANLAVLGIYWCLSLGIGVPPKLSLTIASAIGFLIAYGANRTWSFGYRGERAASLVRYALGYLASFCLQWIIMDVGSDVLGYPHQWVVVFGLVVATPFFYALQRLWVFPRRRDMDPAPSRGATS